MDYFAELHGRDIQGAVAEHLLPCLAGICTEYADCVMMYFEEVLLGHAWSRNGHFDFWEMVPEGKLKQQYVDRVRRYCTHRDTLISQVANCLRKSQFSLCNRVYCFYAAHRCVCGNPIRS